VLTPFRAPVTFTPDSDSITIDFTSKGGPADPRGAGGGAGISRWMGISMDFFFGIFWEIHGT